MMASLDSAHRACVTVFKHGRLLVSAEGDNYQVAIDKAARLLVEKGFEWDGLPVALGALLKERPRWVLGEIVVTLYQL